MGRYKKFIGVAVLGVLASLNKHFGIEFPPEIQQNLVEITIGIAAVIVFFVKNKGEE